MKARVSLPYLFLTVLFAVGTFLAGVRHGGRVEKTNEAINFVLSIPPSKPPPTPVVVKPVGYKTYANSYCGITFVHPDVLTPDSDEAADAGTIRFVDADKKNPLTIQCFGPRLTAIPDKEQKVATTSVTFKTKKIVAEKLQGTDLLRLRVTHPRTNYILIITIDKKLFPLFEKTLEFTT